MKTYVVIGATGHTGKPVTLGLLEHGHTVRIVTRNPDKAKELTDKGALVYKGNIWDTGLLKHAFEGADALYTLFGNGPEASIFMPHRSPGFSVA